MSPVLELTRNLIQLNTVNPPGNERECAMLLGKMLEEAGFTVSYSEFADSRTGFIASTDRDMSGRTICFTGHLDTVPLGGAEWSVDPFSGERAGDKLFGRGSSDMKSGVAAMVCAAIQLAKDLNHASVNNLILAVTAGEETGCHGAHYLYEIDERLKEVDAFIVGEPTGNYPLLGHKGALWLDLVATGKTGHGSMPNLGVNAIQKASNIINKLEAFEFDVEPHEILGSPTLNIGTIKGGININSIPDLVHIGVDIRTIPGMNHEEIKNKLMHYLIPELSCINTIIDLEAVWSEFNNNWVQEVFDICRKYRNSELVPSGVNYFTDACAFLSDRNSKVPALILGPGEPSLAHQTDEYCYMTKIEQAVEIYRSIMMAWCKLN